MDETPAPPEVSDDEVASSMSDAAESAAPITSARAQRFYDRIRGAIHGYLEKKGTVAEKSGQFLLLVPDVFMLLWRLLNDSRVTGKDKVLVASAVAYYVFPFDLIPEGLLGPVGFIDDLVLGVYALNTIMNNVDIAIVREHWSGSGDVLDTIQRVMKAADSLIGSELLNRIKRLVK